MAKMRDAHGESRRETTALESSRALESREVKRLTAFVSPCSRRRALWESALSDANAAAITTDGDALLAALTIAYLGPASASARAATRDAFASILRDANAGGFATDPAFALERFACGGEGAAWHGDGDVVRTFAGAGAERAVTAHDAESVIIARASSRPTIVLDPDGACVDFLASESDWTALDASDSGSIRRATLTLRSGGNVLLSVGADADQSVVAALASSRRGRLRCVLYTGPHTAASAW